MKMFKCKYLIRMNDNKKCLDSVSSTVVYEINT